ncbi:DUF4843 domain-containing protein [Echinicola sp. CAU 1574]|uniref:DUF4843 domain-containing protein n=1 Tax=Echinicola arenosa TaxID=2774144 RepID=A0ABR9AIS8_9BACT|nr:DUF4843 domain-containing protein [Echinicola arenosa]MBD8487758.1 DUF4843 domain-containing protein [Echinicola arenosa]
MKNTIRNIFLFIVIVMCWSCVEDELMTYTSSTDSIYFTFSKKEEPAIPFDSIYYSVGLVPADFTDSLVSIPVKIMGNKKDYDRAFSVELSEKSTAVEGTNFKIENELVIPAGAVESAIQIRLFKTPDIAEDTVMIGFDLLPNEYFNTEMKNYVNEFGEIEVSHVNFELYLTGTVSEPQNWFAPFLGPFSLKKLMLMNEVLGIDPLTFSKGRLEISKMMYFGKAMKRYLDLQRAAGNTVYEEDGTEMEMGAYF